MSQKNKLICLALTASSVLSAISPTIVLAAKVNAKSGKLSQTELKARIEVLTAQANEKIRKIDPKVPDSLRQQLIDVTMANLGREIDLLSRTRDEKGKVTNSAKPMAVPRTSNGRKRVHVRAEGVNGSYDSNGNKRSDLLEEMRSNGVVVPETMLRVGLNGEVTQGNISEGISLGAIRPSDFQVVARFINDEPTDPLVDVTNANGREKIVIAYLNPEYQEKIFTAQGSRGVVEKRGTILSLSGNKLVLLYQPRDSDVWFQLGAPSDHVRTENHVGQITDVSSPTGKATLVITDSHLTYGGVKFSRDEKQDFLTLSELERRGRHEEADKLALDPSSYGIWYKNQRVIDAKMIFRMSGVDLNNRPVIYDFTVFKSDTDSKSGQYIVVASPHDAEDYGNRNYRRRMFRLDIFEGKMTEFELKGEGHVWSTSNFRIQGIGIQGQGGFDPLIGTGDLQGVFLGYMPKAVMGLTVEAENPSGSKYHPEANVVLGGYIPLEGEEFARVSVVLQHYLGGANVLSPTAGVSPLSYRNSLLDRGGVSREFGVQLGDTAEFREGTVGAQAKSRKSAQKCVNALMGIGEAEGLRK